MFFEYLEHVRYSFCSCSLFFFFFFFNDTATTEIYTLSLHDALPIWGRGGPRDARRGRRRRECGPARGGGRGRGRKLGPVRRRPGGAGCLPCSRVVAAVPERGRAVRPGHGQ